MYGESGFEQQIPLMRRRHTHQIHHTPADIPGSESRSRFDNSSYSESENDRPRSRRRIDESDNGRRFGHNASLNLFFREHLTDQIRVTDSATDANNDNQVEDEHHRTRTTTESSSTTALHTIHLESNPENNDENGDGLPDDIPENVREYGRSDGIDIEAGTSNQRVYQSAAQHYAYRIMQRADDNIILKGRKLFQQFICDMYIKIESIRMQYFRSNQDKLRAEEYDVYKEAINSGTTPSGIGKPIILPSSFTGGPRSQSQLYQDNMALVRKYGKPDLFITMTANPQWKEIQNSLLPNQKSEDRPDIVSRVFWLKFKELRKKIINDRLFGKVKCMVYVIEWQKVNLLNY
jgi:hypothetical protein